MITPYDPILYFVRWKDGDRIATYCCGPQQFLDAVVPGGILGFVTEGLAQPFAAAVNGWIDERRLTIAVKRCQELEIPLFVRLESGETQLCLKTIPASESDRIIKCEGEERRALLEAAGKNDS